MKILIHMASLYVVVFALTIGCAKKQSEFCQLPKIDAHFHTSYKRLKFFDKFPCAAIKIRYFFHPARTEFSMKNSNRVRLFQRSSPSCIKRGIVDPHKTRKL